MPERLPCEMSYPLSAKDFEGLLDDLPVQPLAGDTSESIMDAGNYDRLPADAQAIIDEVRATTDARIERRSQEVIYQKLGRVL